MCVCKCIYVYFHICSHTYIYIHSAQLKTCCRIGGWNHHSGHRAMIFCDNCTQRSAIVFLTPGQLAGQMHAARIHFKEHMHTEKARLQHQIWPQKRGQSSLTKACKMVPLQKKGPTTTPIYSYIYIHVYRYINIYIYLIFLQIYKTSQNPPGTIKIKYASKTHNRKE